MYQVQYGRYDCTRYILYSSSGPRVVPGRLFLARPGCALASVESVLAGVGVCAVVLFCSAPVAPGPRSLSVSPRSRPPPPCLCVSLNEQYKQCTFWWTGNLVYNMYLAGTWYCSCYKTKGVCNPVVHVQMNVN